MKEVEKIPEMTFQSRSLYRNPRKVSEEDVIEILEKCIYII